MIDKEREGVARILAETVHPRNTMGMPSPKSLAARITGNAERDFWTIAKMVKDAGGRWSRGAANAWVLTFKASKMPILVPDQHADGDEMWARLMCMALAAQQGLWQ